MNESSQIDISDIRDQDNQVAVGDQIVTSNISDLYLPGIPVGYITDFEHLEKVFVILQTKDSITENQGE